MFTATEIEYIRSLIESMRGQGYDYYIARTITERDNTSDLEIVFSDSKITADSLYSYRGISGYRYTVDSGSSSTDGVRRVQVNSISGSYSVPQTEHCYTNAVFSGGTIQPDIRQQGGVTIDQNAALLGVSVLFLLVFVALRIFGKRRG